MPLAALAFFEIGNGPALMILAFLPAVVGIAAIAAARAVYRHRSKISLEESHDNSRMGWNVLAVALLLVALGIVACYGYVVTG